MTYPSVHVNIRNILDYENIYGFGGGCIYGDRRADFALSADSGTDGAAKNQSSAIIYAFAPSVTVPTVWT